MPGTTPWTPTAAALPDSDTTVIVYSPRSNEPVWLGYHDGLDWRYVEGAQAHGVTHWMELPEGPTS